MEKDEFATRKQALALKELGFNEHCLATWEKDIKYPQRWDWDFELRNSTNQEDEVECTAPLKQQVFRWFRDKHEWYANLSSWLHEEEIGTYHEFEIYGANQYAHGSVPFKTYEEAENACIDKLIEISKEQQ